MHVLRGTLKSNAATLYVKLPQNSYKNRCMPPVSHCTKESYAKPSGAWESRSFSVVDFRFRLNGTARSISPVGNLEMGSLRHLLPFRETIIIEMNASSRRSILPFAGGEFRSGRHRRERPLCSGAEQFFRCRSGTQCVPQPAGYGSSVSRSLFVARPRRTRSRP